MLYRHMTKRVKANSKLSGETERPTIPAVGRHPVFGVLKGMMHIPPGVDLTEPACPEWADLLDEKYGPERAPLNPRYK